MPTHFYRYRLPAYGDTATDHAFHMSPAVAYRLRNALLAAGAIDPEEADPGEPVHFLELYDEKEAKYHVHPEDILITVALWRGRIPGVQVHAPRGLSEGERTTLITELRRPAHKQVRALALPRVDSEGLATQFVAWAERAAREAGGFVVLP